MTARPRSPWRFVLRSAAALASAALLPAAVAEPAPATFCNPLNLDYGLNAKGWRHSADPVIVLFHDRYFLFATDDVPGCRVSDDLLTWSNVPFASDLRPLMSDNDRGTYCAPAVAEDGRQVYFIRMSRRREATVPVMRSADPASGRWERCGTLRAVGDPALFFDDDRRAWLYHGLGRPTRVFEIDTRTWTEIPGSEVTLRAAVTNVADFTGGYERGRRELLDETDTSAWLGRFAMLPCQEAAWMTKHGGRYHLQYSTPGTVTAWYCDVALEGDSPTGPFRLSPDSPVSLKVGGFIGSAGHSCVFSDRHGNAWRVTTMWVGVHDLFERRLGLFPVTFDAAGRMHTETALGDYPQTMPASLVKPGASPSAGWRVQSFGRACEASSSLTNHPPSLAADENVRTWWSAASGDAGEWFRMDLGSRVRIRAVQVNFAEQDCRPPPADAPAEPHRYALLGSDDGVTWRMLADRRGNARPVPHDYLVFDPPVSVRHLKVENAQMPAGGRFALRDLRVFGPGEGRPPVRVEGLKVTRHADDDRNVALAWTPVAGADGYLVRYGLGAARLWQCVQIQGGGRSGTTLHSLHRGVRYVFRLDAFNAGGVTPGEAVAPAP